MKANLLIPILFTVTTIFLFSRCENKPSNAVAVAVPPATTIPTGTIVAFGDSVIPLGWAKCDGTAKDTSDAEFRPLYKVIGFTWGQLGPNFYLPELNNRFLMGVSIPKDLGVPGGSASHKHEGFTLNANYPGQSDGYHVDNDRRGTPQATGLNHFHRYTTDDKPNLPLYKGVFYIIKK